MTQQSLPAPSLFPVLSGLFAGLITVLAFALPQLMHLRKISPLRVLRRNLDPLPLNNYIIYGLAIIALILLSPWQSGNLKLTIYIVSGLFLTALLLALSAKLMINLLRRLQPKLKLAARYGSGECNPSVKPKHHADYGYRYRRHRYAATHAGPFGSSGKLAKPIA